MAIDFGLKSENLLIISGFRKSDFRQCSVFLRSERYKQCRLTYINYPLFSFKGVVRVYSVQRLAYGLDGLGFESQQVQDILIFSKTSRSALGPSSILFNIYRESFRVARACTSV